MHTICVISDNQKHFNYFYNQFSNLPLHFSWMHGVDMALKYIPVEKPALILLVDESVQKLVEWIQLYKHKGLSVPFVCFTRALDWTSRETLWKLGAADVIRLPLIRTELEYILRALAITIRPKSEPGFGQIRGRLDDMNLLDLIPVFESGKKNGVLVLENGAQKGEIEFNHGKIVNAVFQDSDPLEAMCILSGWSGGRYYANPDKQKRRERILLTNQQVVWECQNYLNTIDNLLRKLPAQNAVLFSAPDLAYEELNPQDRTFLLNFKNGFTIQNFLNEYTGNVRFILQKISLWVNKKWLIHESEYRALIQSIEARESRSAIGKTLKRIFGKNRNAGPAVNPDLNDPSGNEELTDQPAVKKPYEFTDFDIVKRFINALEEA
jgi:DNA-binding response OmpR family regulator